MITTATTRTPRPMLSLLLTVGVLAVAVAGVGARPAHADACFGGGHYQNTRDAQPDGAAAGDGQVVGFRRGSRAGRTTGTGLVLAAGLGLVWIGGRRKNRLGAKPDQDLTETATDRHPPTKRSP